MSTSFSCFGSLPIPHNMLSLLLPIPALHFQHLSHLPCISYIKRVLLFIMVLLKPKLYIDVSTEQW